MHQVALLIDGRMWQTLSVDKLEPHIFFYVSCVNMIFVFKHTRTNQHGMHQFDLMMVIPKEIFDETQKGIVAKKDKEGAGQEAEGQQAIG